MKNEFLQFKKIFTLTPFAQIATICILCVITVFEYTQLYSTQSGTLHLSTFFAPIYEELIFRGAILWWLVQKMTNKNAVILSSILFGLWHIKNIFVFDSTYVLYQMGYTCFVFGPLLAVLTLKFKTIWPGVIIHYIHNILAPLSWIVLALF